MTNKFSAKLKTTATIVFILLMASSLLMFNPQVKAAVGDTQVAGSVPAGVTPSVTVPTEAFLAITPNPIGIGQSLLVNMWLQPPTDVSRNFQGAYTVTFTKPDGTTDVKSGIDSFAGDTTAYFEYVPDQVGTWQVKFDFIGTYFPPETVAASMFSAGGLIQSAYYSPSSTPWINLTVQQDQVMSWPSNPIPTDYWTRPVTAQNREWWPVLGNFPATGVVGGGSNWPADTNTYMSNYNYLPYTQGPLSAHVVWRQQYMDGGLVGGTEDQVSLTSSGLTGVGFPTLIYNGRCYEGYQKPGTGATSQYYFRCYDLQTGKVYWDEPAITVPLIFFGMNFGTMALMPTFIEYAKQGAEVPGATAREGVNVYLDTITSGNGATPGRLIKWDPYTGAIDFNLTGPSSDISGNTLYGYPYVLGVQTIGFGPTAQYRLINWTIENNAGNWVTAGGGGQPTVDNFAARVKSNITWPWPSLGTVQDFDSMIAVNVGAVNTNGTNTGGYQTLQAASLLTGQVLWNTTTDTGHPGLDTFFSTSDAVADHGKFACRMLDGPIKCWDLNTGKLLWTSNLTGWPWGVFGAYTVQSAYGLYFTEDYAGVHAINWTNGNIEWTFQAPSVPFETPYNEGYSWHAAAYVADGVYYTFTCEHTPSEPITRGWKLYALNATTGQNIWNVSEGSGIPSSRAFQGAISDGYLAITNEYDGYMYVYGKGQSSTTVSAPQTAITQGQSIEITGKVLDQSPGSPGTPCISDDFMGQWMDHLYQQQPMPKNATGVTVSLDATDPNGNTIHIGDVTSDISGTFKKLWQPELAGEYTITATFAGSNSYGSSYATTGLGVTQAPQATVTPTATPAQQSSTDMYLAGSTIAIIIAIAIVGLLMLRKKP